MYLEKYPYEQQFILLFMIDLLNTKQYSVLHSVACEFVNKYGYKNSDITKATKSKFVNYIKSLMSANPQILQGLSIKNLQKIKFYTVFLYILGYKLYSKNIPFIPAGFCTEIKYNVNVCMDMLRKYVWSRNKISEIRKGDNVLFSVSCGCSVPCEYYNLMYKNKQFELKNIPELPDENCPLEIGCQCLLRVHYL